MQTHALLMTLFLKDKVANGEYGISYQSSPELERKWKERKSKTDKKKNEVLIDSLIKTFQTRKIQRFTFKSLREYASKIVAYVFPSTYVSDNEWQRCKSLSDLRLFNAGDKTQICAVIPKSVIEAILDESILHQYANTDNSLFDSVFQIALSEQNIRGNSRISGFAVQFFSTCGSICWEQLVDAVLLYVEEGKFSDSDNLAWITSRGFVSLLELKPLPLNRAAGSFSALGGGVLIVR